MVGIFPVFAKVANLCFVRLLPVEYSLLIHTCQHLPPSILIGGEKENNSIVHNNIKTQVFCKYSLIRSKWSLNDLPKVMLLDAVTVEITRSILRFSDHVLLPKKIGPLSYFPFLKMLAHKLCLVKICVYCIRKLIVISSAPNPVPSLW